MISRYVCYVVVFLLYNIFSEGVHLVVCIAGVMVLLEIVLAKSLCYSHMSRAFNLICILITFIRERESEEHVTCMNKLIALVAPCRTFNLASIKIKLVILSW